MLNTICSIRKIFLFFTSALFLALLLGYSASINKTSEMVQSTSIKKRDIKYNTENCSKSLIDDFMDFEGFDNNKDNFSSLIVPNYIHLIFLNKNEFKFYEYVNIFAIFLNQKPDRIYLHCDLCDFKGRYWEEMNSIEELRKIFVINRIPTRDTIFGTKAGWIHHRFISLVYFLFLSY